MGQKKSLNISIEDIPEPGVSQPHFDKLNSEFAQEHYGTYIIYKTDRNNSESHTRTYVKYSNGIKFRKMLLSEKKLFNKESMLLNYKKSKHSLIDIYPEYELFIKDTIVKVIPENLTRISGINYLKGLSAFLKVIRTKNIPLTKLCDIKSEYQNIVWQSLEIIGSQYEKKSLYTFFNAVSNYLDGFLFQNKLSSKSTKSRLGLPTTTLFQIDYYCCQEIEYNLKTFKETQKWILEYKEMDQLFSLENLAYTYYKGYEVNRINQRMMILKLAEKLYGVQLNSWKDRRRSNKKTVYEYISDNQRRQHMELLEISKNGFDIVITNEKLCLFWILECIPNPLCLDLEHEVYGDIVNWQKLFFIAEPSINLDKLRSRLYPTIQKVYPLFLLLLIRLGLNDDVLKTWSVSLNKDNKYLLGEDLGIVTIIKGLKSKSNDIQWTPIKKKSDTQKYIDFYQEWLSPIYEKSDSSYFFQYAKLGAKKEYAYIRTNSLRSARKSENWFFKKYKIYMPDKTRVEYIDHRQPRVNKQFNDYIKGLDEWERQFKKSHNSIDTQLHYDNMDERKIVQRNKLGKVLNLAEGIFRGTISSEDNKKLKVFDGLLSDCCDPKNPTYIGAQKLNSNEVCSDWFMCLVGCDKSIVDYKIHGPAIMAHFEFINELKENLTDEIWRKEYGLHFDVAEEIIEEKMTQDEREYCKGKKDDYYDVVRMQFKRKRTFKGIQNVG
tara:strand:+ start:15097 stop:17247 length:2151 start_codon:yes stop_codon:yes gene_type:complete